MINLNEDKDSRFTDKREAVKRIEGIANEAIEAINKGLNCCGELVAKEYHMARDAYGANIYTTSGKIGTLSNILFKNAARGKISKSFEVSVSQYAGNLEIRYICGKSSSKNFGFGIDSKPVTAETFDEIRELVMSDAVPKIIKGVNAAYAFYKKKYQGGKES